MNIKSLLLGSAAALVAVSGARAADVIVADPEPVEYVRVCDAYGTGFFYIPGTETCLNIGGYVRYDIRFGNDHNQTIGTSNYGWNKLVRAQLEIDAREETEYGTLRSFIAFQGNVTGSGGVAGNGTAAAPWTGFNSFTNAVGVDAAFIELAGLHIGYSDNAFDAGIAGEFDALGGAKIPRIAYTFSSGAFDATISIDDDGDTINNPGAFVPGADFMPNVSANIGGTFGAFTARLYGAYDNDTDNFAIKGIVGVDVTSNGHIDLAAYYTDGPTYVLGASVDLNPAVLSRNGIPLWAEWSVAGSYTHTFNEKLSATIGAQYWDNLMKLADGPFAFMPDISLLRVGGHIDYRPTPNFLTRFAIDYNDWGGDINNFALVAPDGTHISDSFVKGYVRFQRDF